MNRLLLVDIKQLTSAHQADITAAAAARGFEVVFAEDEAAALAAAKDAEIIFGANVALPKAAPNLKWLCVPSAGADQYLKPEVYANPDAVLTNSSGAYGVTIAEHIVMVTLEMMRRIPEYNAVVARHGWLRTLPIRSIRSSRVALLGVGDIGQEAARRLKAFGTSSITGINRSGRHPGGPIDAVVPLEGLDEILPKTDLLIMSLPGTPETRHLMDEARLRLLPSDAFLVNVGRGTSIDQKALEALMRAGHLSGAALDVFEQEPIDPEDTIWDCPRLIITPHVAGNMTLDYTVDRIASLFLEDFENYCAGRPLRRRVTRDKGY